MYALGIETSCDETSCAVVKKRDVLANVTVSSLKYHKKYGGIIPEIATRNHLKFIEKVFKVALFKARVNIKDIEVIGVTYRPGLLGALVVGLNFAKAVSSALGKPFLGINHLHAHLFSPFLNSKPPIPFPFVGLVASGGHTDLFLVKDFDRIKTIATTKDDACGEAFDKVARFFGLDYPGGVYIDKLYSWDFKDSFPFKCGKVGFDFSFSGIKTAVIYKKMELEKKKELDRIEKIKILSSFTESVVKTLVERITDAAKKFKVKNIVCGGGVIANRRLRQLLRQAQKNEKLKLFLPSQKYTTDNAAMVAGLTFYLYNKKRLRSNIHLKAEVN
ncbi:MAG: tRNA (adenosine(37)-N6)-threonylcarbamoyltransferase complex transferase subunit TsaD [Candidatus Omnitrophica bacterium]|nr:tRNA (adenosine(37)-N6)-threonylcarbamoyltransferase complex transferase subunit TsaD [Candidatus Omnitrophota bacterium]